MRFCEEEKMVLVADEVYQVGAASACHADAITMPS